MTRLTICFLFITTIGFFGYSQDYIDDNRFSVELETGLATPILNGIFETFSFNATASVSAKYDQIYMPPAFGLNLGYTINENIRTIFRFSLKSLQNNQFSYYTPHTEYQSGNFTVFQSFTDSFKLSSNAINSSIGFRYYTNEVPVGFYVEVNGGYSQVVSTIYPTFVKSDVVLYGGDEVVVIEKGAPGVYKNGFIKTSFGLGGTLVLPNKMFFDFGARLSYFYGSYHLFNDIDEGGRTISEFRDNFLSYVKLAQLTNIQSTYLFETHASIGLFF